MITYIDIQFWSGVFVKSERKKFNFYNKKNDHYNFNFIWNSFSQRQKNTDYSDKSFFLLVTINCLKQHALYMSKC